MSKRKAAECDNGGGVRHGEPLDPSGLIARNNALSAVAFMDEHWSFESLQKEILREIQRIVAFKCASDMEETELQACFDLIEETSRHDYEPSSFGWHPKRKMREMREKNMRYLLIRNGDCDIEGFLSFMLTHDSVPAVPVLYVYEIHLSARHQGKGVGKTLMAIAHGISESVGVDKVMLTCFKNNVKARAFYERLGYRVDISSPEDRTTRNKVVKTDYVIMSKNVARLKPGQSLEETIQNTVSKTGRPVSISAADKPSASRHSLPGRLPNGHVLGERAVGGLSAQQATGRGDTVWNQEIAQRFLKDLINREREVLERGQYSDLRAQRVRVREREVNAAEQRVAEREDELDGREDELDGREEDLDQRQQDLDEIEDHLFQRETALRETLSMQDRARLNIRARARALKQREVRFDNRELRDREKRTREANNQVGMPGSNLYQPQTANSFAEWLANLGEDDGDAYDDEEEDGEEDEEDDEEEDEDEDCEIKEEDEVKPDILKLAKADREARKVNVLGKATFELPKPESMRGQQVVKDKVETWLRRSGTTAESFTKRALI